MLDIEWNSTMQLNNAMNVESRLWHSLNYMNCMLEFCMVKWAMFWWEVVMMIMILSSSRARHWFGPSVHMHGCSQWGRGGS